MKITYDKIADAAYIYLHEIKSSGVAKTYCCDASEVGGMINLDFDSDGVLLGIEILNANAILPTDLLDSALTIQL